MNDLTLWFGHQDGCSPPHPLLTDVQPHALCRVSCGPAPSRGLAHLTRGGGGGKTWLPSSPALRSPASPGLGALPCSSAHSKSGFAVCPLHAHLCTGPATSHDHRAGCQALHRESAHLKVRAFFLGLGAAVSFPSKPSAFCFP